APPSAGDERAEEADDEHSRPGACRDRRAEGGQGEGPGAQAAEQPEGGDEKRGQQGGDRTGVEQPAQGAPVLVPHGRGHPRDHRDAERDGRDADQPLPPTRAHRVPTGRLRGRSALRRRRRIAPTPTPATVASWVSRWAARKAGRNDQPRWRRTKGSNPGSATAKSAKNASGTQASAGPNAASGRVATAAAAQISPAAGLTTTAPSANRCRPANPASGRERRYCSRTMSSRSAQSSCRPTTVSVSRIPATRASRSLYSTSSASRSASLNGPAAKNTERRIAASAKIAVRTRPTLRRRHQWACRTL